MLCACCRMFFLMSVAESWRVDSGGGCGRVGWLVIFLVFVSVGVGIEFVLGIVDVRDVGGQVVVYGGRRG